MNEWEDEPVLDGEVASDESFSILVAFVVAGIEGKGRLLALALLPVLLLPVPPPLPLPTSLTPNSDSLIIV